MSKQPTQKDPTQIIQEALDNAGIQLASPVTKKGPGNDGYYVFIASTRDRSGRLNPNKSLIDDLKSKLRNAQVNVEIIISTQSVEDGELALRAGLLQFFPQDVRNVFLSNTAGGLSVWLEAKRSFSEETEEELKKSITTFTRSISSKISSINIITAEKVPTRLALLKIMRQISPCSTEDISKSIEFKGSSIPSPDWTKRNLDGLRKSGMIIRRKDGRYFLTLEALNILGTTKGRNSPDIQRLLALARQK